MAISKKLTTFAMATGLVMASIQPTIAAQYYDEDEFGPSYETMVVDTVAGKPLQLLAVAAGAVTYVVSYPFSHLSGSTEQAQQTLVQEPWEAFRDRCLGCTEAEARYYYLQNMQNDGYVRMVINEPSEILIKTDDNVIINDMAGTVSR